MHSFRLLVSHTLLGFAVLLLLIHSANAALINYDESVDGDLPDPGLTTFALDMAGNHSISGSTSWVQTSTSESWDFDEFFLTLAPSLVISNFAFSFSNGIQQNITAEVVHRLLDFDAGFLAQSAVYDIGNDSSTNQVNPPYGTLPMSALNYRFYNDARVQLGGTFQHPFSANWDWNVSITTSAVPAVPIPAAIWLFGTALIGLVGFSKRRKVA